MIIQRQSPLLKLYPIEIFRRYTVYFHSNTIINRANKLAEIAADTFLFGLSLLLPPQKGGSGAALQFQTIYSTTSTILQSQTNKKCDQLFGLRVGGLPFGKVGMGFWMGRVLVVIQRQPSLLKLYPIQILRRYTVYFHGNTIINRANKLAEIAADTFLFGLSLLLPPQKGGSGAALQFQTIYSTTSTILQSQTNKKCHQLFGLRVGGLPFGKIGMGFGMGRVDNCITMEVHRVAPEYLNWIEFQKRGLPLNDH